MPGLLHKIGDNFAHRKVIAATHRQHHIGRHYGHVISAYQRLTRMHDLMQEQRSYTDKTTITVIKKRGIAKLMHQVLRLQGTTSETKTSRRYHKKAQLMWPTT